MKTSTHIKFIEWRDTKGLHEDTMNAISDLEFMADELHFLTNLITEHTLELLYGKPFEESKFIAQSLSKHNKTLNKMMLRIENHRNDLQILMDDIEVPNELRKYKDQHFSLLMDVMNFYSEVKKTKSNIFNMLSETMKKNKQKNLL